MSRALHQLEKESGYVLFESSAGYLKFTRAGMRFVENARHIVEDYRLMSKDMRAFSADQARPAGAPVRIIATPATTRYLMPFLDLQTPGAFPFEVLLREDSLAGCIDMMKTTAPSNTFGFVSLPATQKYLGILDESAGEAGLIFQPVAKSGVVAMVSTSCPLSRREAIDSSADTAGMKFGYLLDEMLLDYTDDYVRESDMPTITSNLSILEEQIATNQIVTFMVKLYLATHTLPEGVCAVPCTDTPDVLFGFLGTKEELEGEDVKTVCASVRSTLVARRGEERFRGMYECVEPLLL